MLRDAVKAADASGEISDDVKENLTLLMELAESKCHEWLASIEKDLASGKMGTTCTSPSRGSSGEKQRVALQSRTT